MIFDSLDDPGSDGFEASAVAQRAASDVGSEELARQVNAYPEEGDAGGPSVTSLSVLTDGDHSVDRDGGSFE